MAQIAEDLFLLLLDNSSGLPSLERRLSRRLLGAAVLLDLAHACRIRPVVDGEPVAPGHLVALAGATPLDAVTGPAFDVLVRRPRRPAAALTKVAKHTEGLLVAQLERVGQLHRVSQGKTTLLPLLRRDRVDPARGALLAALFDRQPPPAPTAAIISLLHAADGLGALLSLNDRGWRWVHARAGEIALGSWLDEQPTGLAEVNLAVTASALRPVLAG